MNLLVTILVASLGAVGLTVAIRAVPPFSRWNEKGVKPWACDLCMSFWGTLLFVVTQTVVGEGPYIESGLAWMPAFALAYGIVQRIVPTPMGGPPIDPPSPDGLPGEET